MHTDPKFQFQSWKRGSSEARTEFQLFPSKIDSMTKDIHGWTLSKILFLANQSSSMNVFSHWINFWGKKSWNSSFLRIKIGVWIQCATLKNNLHLRAAFCVSLLLIHGPLTHFDHRSSTSLTKKGLVDLRKTIP